MDWSIDSSWTLFLDRDGVINQRNFHGYITKKEDFHFLDGVLEALSSFTNSFGRIVVVTNQQGVGKNIMSLCNLNELHDYMLEEVERHNGRIDKVYFATNLRTETPNHRKPGRYMADLAKSDFPEIDFNKSVMVGDTDSDIAFGKQLGMKTVLIESDEDTKSNPDVKVESLKELLKKI